MSNLPFDEATISVDGRPDNAKLKKRVWNDALKWIAEIPVNNGLVLYPLQFANAIRILYNDAVFIFDEVGCGKTITSGIMAKSYLWQNKNKHPSDILVITTNTVKTNEQFEKDWEKIDGKLKPIVYNNLVNSDLNKLSKDKKWGLVVIDEAHEFSNNDTERYQRIKEQLRADKVVFLTATPLRGGGNFKFYKELANAILAPDQPKEYEELDKLSNEEEEKKRLICAKFDPTNPVTRYFKDTVKYLDIHEKKEKARRVIPELWYPNSDPESGNIDRTREDTLVRNICAKLSVNANSKFVVFVRFRKEADKLKDEIANGLIQFKKERCQNKEEKLSVVSVFAEKKSELKKYGDDTSDLPTVLIVNYQIGEAGVNLPGYDHVIHWHISSDPVRLEQRYGRIDRMTSRHDEIHSCFVIPNSVDSNYRNLNLAIYYTMGELLTRLPARNVLLTKDTLKFFRNDFEKKLRYYQDKLEKYKGINLENLGDDQLVSIFTKIEEGNDGDITISGHENIIDFIKEEDIVWEREKEEKSILREKIQDELDKQIRRLKKKTENDDGKNIASFHEKIDDIENKSDQIFYATKPNDLDSLKTIDSQDGGCAQYIQESSDYQLFEKIVKLQNAIREVLQYGQDLFYL